MTAAGLIRLLYNEMKTSKRFDDIENAIIEGENEHALIVYPFDSQPIVLTARVAK